MKRKFLIVFIVLSILGMGNTSAADRFPYPSVPSELKTPSERGRYVIEHYWDNYDFSDTLLVDDKEVAEIGFVNFIDLLPRFGAETTSVGISNFAEKVFDRRSLVPHKVYSGFLEMIDSYLYSYSSPMRNDTLYINIAECILDIESSVLDEALRSRMSYRATNLKKNAIGTVAADFTFVNRKRKKQTLHNSVLAASDGESRSDTAYTLLFFYEPDCFNCREAVEKMVENKIENVVAIYADADTDRWRHSHDKFPESWTDGYSPEGQIVAQQIYFIRKSPAIYLLDRNCRVVLKDAKVEDVIDFIRQHK